MSALSASYCPGTPSRPCLVWLHGFLGDRYDWQLVQPYFRAWPQLAVDLPGHGESAWCVADDFAAVSARLSATLQAYGIQRYWLIGYSLGGRLAMYHACRGDASGLAGLAIEGSHPGLEDPTEQQARIARDMRWARRFSRQPLPAVLEDWYCQPIFDSLDEPQRQAMIQSRLTNSGVTLAGMLMATSLGKQPFLVPALRALTVPLGYFCGELDKKFTALARRYDFPLWLIPGAGHNTHRTHPEIFARQLHAFLTQSEHKESS